MQLTSWEAFVHTQDISPWQHAHTFGTGNPLGERNTWKVVALTAVMMVVEIAAGMLWHSMALLADGWHMSTHAAALGITGMAYILARRYASDERFTFGTWKIEILGGFASAIILGMVALYMAAESVQRLFRPLVVQYDQALAVAVLGLAVNLASVLILQDHQHDGHHHDHDHPGHGQARGATDLNLRSAYLHVIADATTSLLAIGALLGGKFLRQAWLDPVMGVVGAALVGAWAYGLIRQTSRVLLDREMDSPIVQEIRSAIEADGDTRISDLHLWGVGRGKYACSVCLVAGSPKEPQEYRAMLGAHDELAHVTVEVQRCPSHA